MHLLHDVYIIALSVILEWKTSYKSNIAGMRGSLLQSREQTQSRIIPH